MRWCCPVCHGDLLTEKDESIGCRVCRRSFPCIGGIPDFRVPGAAWIDFEEDLKTARQIEAETAGMPVDEVVAHVYSQRPGWTAELVALRTDQVMQAPHRLRRDLGGWLKPCVEEDGFVDLGCGPGMLLAAAAMDGHRGVGIDVSMTWLVVAKRLIEAFGGTPVLAGAMAESLPFRTSSVPAVISLDVIEHVAHPAAFLMEIERVTRSGGSVALVTPNRYSLTREPHVFVWGVGLVPRRWQPRYVALRSGKPYEYTRLLSTWEARKLVRRYTSFSPVILIPEVSDEEIARFPFFRAKLAAIYNRLTSATYFRPVALLVGPFFRLVGRKPVATTIQNGADVGASS